MFVVVGVEVPVELPTVNANVIGLPPLSDELEAANPPLTVRWACANWFTLTLCDPTEELALGVMEKALVSVLLAVKALKLF